MRSGHSKTQLKCCVCGVLIRSTELSRNVTPELADNLAIWHKPKRFEPGSRVHEWAACRKQPTAKRKQPCSPVEEGRAQPALARPPRAVSADAIISFCLFRKRKETRFNWKFDTYVTKLHALVKHLKISKMAAWTIVVYVDSSVNEKTRQSILAAGVNCVREPQHVPESMVLRNGRFRGWLGALMRYWAFADFADASRVVCLDCDLPYSQLMQDSLMDWAESKHEVLRMNHMDYTSAVPICGGFFGLSRGALRIVGKRFLDLVNVHFPIERVESKRKQPLAAQTVAADKRFPYGSDQYFLKERVFPLVKDKFSFLTLVMVGTASMPPVPKQKSSAQVKQDTVYDSRTIAHFELL